MAYNSLEPEVAGELGEGTVMDTSVHPPTVSVLHYEISDWLGDHLVESYPVYLVSQELADALQRAGLRSFELRDARVTLSEDAQELLAGEQLPQFRWLVVTGAAARDDIGVTDNARLVVSDEALRVFQSFPLNHCDVEPYA